MTTIREQALRNLPVQGRKIYLRLVEREDVHGRWWQWFNNKDTTRHMNKGHAENTPETQLGFFERIDQSDSDPVFAVCENHTRQHIGTTALHDIDAVSKSAQFGIIIGEQAFQGIGIGGEAWKLTVDFGFECLGLESIRTKIFAENKAAVRIALRNGFVEKEYIERDVEKDGVFHDRIFLVATQSDWHDRISEGKTDST